jgi:hypothetical protein
MSSHFIRALVLAATGCALAGCAVETTPSASSSEPEETVSAESDISAHSVTFVTLRQDDRKCMAPLCGGFWIKDVNRNREERYVSGLDFSQSGLDEELVARVQGAPVGELIVRGKLGPEESTYGTRALMVYDAYRGMPGVTPITGDIFFQAEDRDPPIQCFTAPCPNEVARKLNTGKAYAFDGYQVGLAARPFVDQDWLIDRVNHHGAIVAALFVQGEEFPGGYAYLLDASQVYLNVADMTGPCSTVRLAQCPEAGSEWTYTRDEDLCVLPVACSTNDNCPSLQPPQCEEGYSVSAWRTDSQSCIAFACDPSFVLPY